MYYTAMNLIPGAYLLPRNIIAGADPLNVTSPLNKFAASQLANWLSTACGGQKYNFTVLLSTEKEYPQA